MTAILEAQTRVWLTKPYATLSDFDIRDGSVDILTFPVTNKGFDIGFALSPRAIRAAQRLRYEVFSLEMGHHVKEEDDARGLDIDEFDEQMMHIVAVCQTSQRIIATYRIQTDEQARKHGRFYSATEFDLEPLIAQKEADGILELGRACVAKAYRNTGAIFYLWKTIRLYMELYDKRWIMGCCSISTQDPVLAWRTFYALKHGGHVNPDLCVDAIGDYHLPAPDINFEEADDIKIPKLFKIYLKLGTQVISYPAIDKAFGTIDFLALNDEQAVRLANLG